MKMQHATRMVPRRPRRSEYEARKAPQKHPAVNRATTVPERESELDWRKLCLKESEATTSAMTPLCHVSEHDASGDLIMIFYLQIITKEKGSNGCKAANQELVDS
jgi:hypothetical protein